MLLLHLFYRIPVGIFAIGTWWRQCRLSSGLAILFLSGKVNATASIL